MTKTLQNLSRVAVGIDVGTSAVKVIAVAEDGEVLERREVPYPLSTPKPGWSEQNPDDWWEATEKALDGLTAMLESHFTYEERTLTTVLDTLDAGPRE